MTFWLLKHALASAIVTLVLLALAPHLIFTQCVFLTLLLGCAVKLVSGDTPPRGMKPQAPEA